MDFDKVIVQSRSARHLFLYYYYHFHTRCILFIYFYNFKGNWRNNAALETFAPCVTVTPAAMLDSLPTQVWRDN